LIQALRYHNRRGKFFGVKLPPEESKVRRYLSRIRFWDRFRFSPEMVRREGMLRFTPPTSLNDIVELVAHPYVGEETSALVKGVLAQSSVGVDVDAVLECVAELSDNFAQHAQTDLATLVVQCYCSVHRGLQGWAGNIVMANAVGAERRSALGAAALLPYDPNPVIHGG
jgi:hypothetical protein